MGIARNVGWLVLLFKLGPKLLPVMAKLGEALWNVAKSAMGLKAAGIAGSVGLYTYLFTWQMAVALVVFIGIHEYGHLWAMKRCGIKTKGMFFIPGFGAVAVADERFGTARNEAYIALLGPVFGLVFFCGPAAIGYWYTKDPQWAAIAAIMAFINMVNLLPVNPLDGGRVLKALAYSKRYKASLFAVASISIVTAGVSVAFGFTLIGVMMIVGLWELADTFGAKRHLRNFLGTALTFVPVIVGWIIVDVMMDSFDTLSWWLIALGCIGLLMMAGAMAVALSPRTRREKRMWKKNFGFLRVPLFRAIQAPQDVVRLARANITPIHRYDPMTAGGKVWYAFAFAALIVVHAAVIFALGIVPGAGLAADLLK